MLCRRKSENENSALPSVYLAAKPEIPAEALQRQGGLYESSGGTNWKKLFGQDELQGGPEEGAGDVVGRRATLQAERAAPAGPHNPAFMLRQN